MVVNKISCHHFNKNKKIHQTANLWKASSCKEKKIPTKFNFVNMKLLRRQFIKNMPLKILYNQVWEFKEMKLGQQGTAIRTFASILVSRRPPKCGTYFTSTFRLSFRNIKEFQLNIQHIQINIFFFFQKTIQLSSQKASRLKAQDMQCELS